MPNNLSLLLILLLLSSTSACINISSFETAEVLPEGESRFHIGFSDYSGTSISAESKNRKRQIWPNVELGYHRGLGQEWEWGLNLTLVGTFESSIKKRLLKNGDFSLALGNSLSYVYYRTENADFFNLWDYHIPLYMSYRWSEMLTFYANPQYISRWFLNGQRQMRSDWGGLTLGTVIYERFATEASYLRSTSGIESFQIGLAIFLK